MSGKARKLHENEHHHFKINERKPAIGEVWCELSAEFMIALEISVKNCAFEVIKSNENRIKY